MNDEGGVGQPLRAGPALRRASGWAVVVLIAALVSGCGSESDDIFAGPLPTGADDPRAYTEHFLAHNPRAQLESEHLAVVRLEPTAGDDGDTCAGRDGVDCLLYAFHQDTQVTLSIAEGAEVVGRAALLDASGATVLDTAADGEPGTAIVPAGQYTLELFHVFAGDSDAAEQTVFIQPSEASENGAEPFESPGVISTESHGAVTTPAPPPRARRLDVTHDCVRCDFSRALLVNQHFDGVTLTGSVFDGAQMFKASFRGAKMESCSLLQLGPECQEDAYDFDYGDFTGAMLAGAHFSFVVLHRCPFVGIFRDAVLDGTTWEGTPICKDIFDSECLASAVAPDFRNASLRGSSFPGVYFPEPCTFQGADLTGADFRSHPPRTGLALWSCRFDREPESGRITILKGADLTGASITSGYAEHGGDLSEADLSGAILENTYLGAVPWDPNFPPAANLGANLAHANLSGARIAGARLSSANLSNATLAGISPASFNGFDLRFTNFTGVDFAGIDLSQADLSQSVLFSGALAATFVGAKLSDGTHGVTLTGQKFPPLYAGLKGTDMTRADLRKADLFQADLEGVTLNNANLVGANLNFANLHKAKLSGAMLGVAPGTEGAAASLRGAFMTDIDLSDADLRSVNLTGAHLYGAEGVTKLERARLDSANLSGAICSGARFSGTLNNAVFNNAQLVNTIFNGATLTGVKFDDTYLQGADFSNAISVTGVTLSNAAVSAAPGFWNFMEQDGTPYVVNYGATKLGPLAADASVRCPNGSLGPCCPTLDLVKCLTEKLKPERNGPFPSVPACVPRPPRYDNCITPVPTRTPNPTRTPTPRP